MKSRAKNFLAFLIVFAIIAISVPNTASAHTHVFDSMVMTSCWAQDNNTHAISQFIRHSCYCGYYYDGTATITAEAHTYGSYSYTGSNYHSGAYHYYEYARSCYKCGSRDAYWSRITCNGNCQVPW